MGHLAGGQLATVGLPVGAVRCGGAWLRLGRAWFGQAWFGEVRSCYAAFNGLNQSVERCVSIIRSGLVGRGGVWLGSARFA